jgi:hypothetical protein
MCSALSQEDALIPCPVRETQATLGGDALALRNLIGDTPSILFRRLD